jgi:hypothetical protein
MHRTITAALISGVLLAGCSESASGPRRSENTSSITGTLVEKVDGPPYSYLRIRTDKGEVWAAVPITSIPKDKPVTVKNGVPLKGFEAKPIGRKFEVVYFGMLERR